MKKQKTEVRKLRIDKETLLPLGSRPMKEVAGGESPWFHYTDTTHYHLAAPFGG
jgi:hypothetical protein